VWFRLFNKTGQRLLMDVDWRTIHLEDSLGGRYVDWRGPDTTSLWVEPGSGFDFDRYYSIDAGKRGRIPHGAGPVRVVVDQFSRISGARWQVAINPTLTPIAAPAEAKAVGDPWEQDGLSLTLTKLEVRAEGDSDDAAAHAWFRLTNHTNQRLLLELDLGHLYLQDSFGRRFNDWQGGGVLNLWLDAGQQWDFDRYYSEMAGTRSRITHGAAFMLVQVEKLGLLHGVQWRLDIVR
jgi:hypothetical protein